MSAEILSGHACSRVKNIKRFQLLRVYNKLAKQDKGY